MRLIYSAIIALTVFLSSAARAADSCQDLANFYAKNATAMSDSELGRLRTCVTEMLRTRLAGHHPTPPPAPTPPPPPAPAPVPKAPAR